MSVYLLSGVVSGFFSALLLYMVTAVYRNFKSVINDRGGLSDD